jgi:hypothetical protein
MALKARKWSLDADQGWEQASEMNKNRGETTMVRRGNSGKGVKLPAVCD